MRGRLLPHVSIKAKPCTSALKPVNGLSKKTPRSTPATRDFFLGGLDRGVKIVYLTNCSIVELYGEAKRKRETEAA